MQSAGHEGSVAGAASSRRGVDAGVHPAPVVTLLVVACGEKRGGGGGDEYHDTATRMHAANAK